MEFGSDHILMGFVSIANIEVQRDMTNLLEKTDEKVDIKPTNNGNHDKFAHHFYKKDLDANIFHGTPMRALCGKVLTQQSDPKGLQVCPECQDWMDNVVGSNRPEGDRD